MTEPDRIVVSGQSAGQHFCDIFGLDSTTVQRVLLQMQPGEPMYAHVTFLVGQKEAEEMFCFLEPLERLDPTNRPRLWRP
jgi:hypothetical protein